ncbi:MAG: LOG family protein [Bacteroidetes bacterium]|nr:LOG family protein [Bacteroidota bacterium]
MKKTITIFGSSKPVEMDEQYKLAYELGSLLAKNGFDICTGGFFGIMEAVSKGAVGNGGEAIGVTVNNWGLDANKYLTKEIKCSSLFERINKLIEAGEGFVILQGGTGTLLELATVWELSNKRLMDNKPIACHSSMWREINSVMNKQMKLEGRDDDIVKSFNTVGEIVEYLIQKLI